MLLENEGEILAMTETVTGTYEGISPIIVDNDNSTISLEQSAKEALDCVVTNSATWNDASGNGGYYSKYQPYGLNAISGNLVIEGSRYPRQTLIGVSSDNSASTAGIIPPVPEQNLTAERYLVAASGSLADVSWKEIPNFDDIQSNSATWNEVSSKLDTTSFSTVSGDFYPYSNPSGFITGVDLSDYYTKNETSGADELANAFNNIPAGDEEVNNTVHTYSGDWNSTYTTVHNNSASWAQGGSFTGVTTDATLTGDGLNSPLGVADTQTLSSDQSISITTAVNGVILGVNSSWFDNAVNSAVTGTQGDAEVNAAVHNNSATWNTVTNKLDTTAFSTVSGDFYPYSNPSGFITGVDLTPYQTIEGMTAYATTGDVSSTEWNSVYETVETNSASWAGGGSVDTIPFIVQSPLTTGFSGTSAYIGIDGDAFESSAYVPVSSLTFTSNYLTQISGKTISAYTARNAYTATYASTATRATNDINGNSITATYQPKLTIAGVDGTITAINNSAVGADVPSGFELVAGANISIVDDAQNSATTISVSGFSAAEWNDCYETVETNSATWGGGTSYTGDAQGALDTVYSTSSNWNGCYSTVESNSATWNNTMTGLFEATYGVTTYSDITGAIANKKLVYCRITPNAASRMAFLAYIGTTNVEFQYYRSVNSHTDDQQGDQVFVYAVDNNNAWTTTVRNAFTKVIAGTGLSSTYSNGASGKLTMSIDGSFIGSYATTGDLNYVSGVVGDVESLLAQL